MQNNNIPSKKDLGIPVVIAIFVVALILGVVVFKNYTQSAREITTSLAKMQVEAPTLTIEQCAAKTMDWYKNCTAMTQLCDNTVGRMIKVCLVNGDKQRHCSQYGNEINEYNFGIRQCEPYLHDRNMKAFKKACGDIWQSVADYCKFH